jgi:ribosome-associated heat shock protein Hsp15
LTPSCRADVWLWRARFFKTRALAAKAIEAGRVRLSSQGVSRVLEKAAAAIRPEDGLTIRSPVRFPDGRSGAALRTVRVLALGERRGPADEARGLYADLDQAH